MSYTRTPLGQRLKARVRKTYDFEVQDYLALGQPVAKVAIRVPTKREQDAALDSAVAYVKKVVKTSGAEQDPDIVQDAKSAAIVASCCLDPSTPDMLPVWPTVDVVSEELTADQIGVLVRLINEVRAKDGPTKIDLDDDRVEAFATMASVGADTDVPDSLLSPLPHPYLVHLYVLTAVKLAKARAELAELKAPKEPVADG